MSNDITSAVVLLSDTAVCFLHDYGSGETLSLSNPQQSTPDGNFHERKSLRINNPSCARVVMLMFLETEPTKILSLSFNCQILLFGAKYVRVKNGLRILFGFWRLLQV